MPPIDYKLIYAEILSYVKGYGIRVIHKNLKGDIGGLFCCKNTIIYINKSSRETLEGCYYLLHEWIHWRDYMEGKFPDFFTGKSMQVYNEANLEYIKRAEMSAIIGGHEKLKWFGAYYKPEEMKRGGMNESIKFWKQYYWGIE